MTGKELILYILQNNLEYEDFFKEALISEEQAAVGFHVGVATVQAWYSVGLLNGLNIEGKVYIFKNQKDPRERLTTCQTV